MDEEQSKAADEAAGFTPSKYDSETGSVYIDAALLAVMYEEVYSAHIALIKSGAVSDTSPWILGQHYLMEGFAELYKAFIRKHSEEIATGEAAVFDFDAMVDTFKKDLDKED